jgi:hypothetical protein
LPHAPDAAYWTLHIMVTTPVVTVAATTPHPRFSALGVAPVARDRKATVLSDYRALISVQ